MDLSAQCFVLSDSKGSSSVDLCSWYVLINSIPLSTSSSALNILLEKSVPQLTLLSVCSFSFFNKVCFIYQEKKRKVIYFFLSSSRSGRLVSSEFRQIPVVGGRHRWADTNHRCCHAGSLRQLWLADGLPADVQRHRTQLETVSTGGQHRGEWVRRVRRTERLQRRSERPSRDNTPFSQHVFSQ